jgi:adenine deaminase
LADALCKLHRGQVVMIREGTAAHNLEALAPLLCEKYADRCMFCCDDRHPLDLLEKGHIDHIVRTAVALGASPVAAVKVACYNPARYFGLDGRGAVAPGYAADLVVVDDLEHFGVLQVYKRGVAVYADGALRAFDPPAVASRLVERAHNTFRVARLTAADFAEDGRPRGVIGLVAGQIVSEDRGRAEGVDLERDVLKIAVVERHRGTGHIGIGYLQGYGLRSGAVATSVAHDAHNVIVVGANDEDMAAAANAVVANKGGIAVVDRGATRGEVALPIAGLMSDEALEQVNAALERAKTTAFDLGVSRGVDPFMTLSFMSLPVIPTLRLTTRGVVDVASQRYV